MDYENSSDDQFQKEDYQSKDLRNLRNLAEKQRRDKLNGYISELANTVPFVTTSSKRLDKTSVLRLSAAYLRLNRTSFGTKKSKDRSKCQIWRPTKFSFDFLRPLIDSVAGFIIVTSGLGKIIYVSHTVENFLGHQNIEMIGYSLLSFLHPSDTELVQNQIQSAHKQVSKGSQTSNKISFQCRLREKSQPRSEVVTYQMVNVSGYMTFESLKEDKNCSKNKTEDSILFKGFVQIIPTNPMAELSLMDADLDEYVSRHSLDGTLLFADHRISGIIGFSPSEVLGNSAYSYILSDDHSIALFAHKLMLSNSNGTGTIVHRLRTSSGSYVFLQSSGCLQYDKTGQIDHWVCVSRLLVSEEGDKERDKFVKRFTPHIYNKSLTALYESLQIVLGPQTSKNVFNSSICSNNDTKSTQKSIEIIEMDSPPAVTPIQTPNTQKAIQRALESLNNMKSTSAFPKSNSTVVPTISSQFTNTAQKPQQLSVTSTQTPIHGLVSNLNGSNVQSIQTIQSIQTSPVVQIQTLPIIPINSEQILTQQTSELNNGFNNNSNITRSNSFSNTNVINMITPTTLSLSYVDTSSLTNRTIDKMGSDLNQFNANNMFSGHFGNTMNIVSKPTQDLTHLLGATVLTFDAQNRPVLSVYSPQMALKENPNNNNNNTKTDINFNNNIKINVNINSKQNDSFDINSLINSKVRSSVDSSVVSPSMSMSMDTSFYSPNNKPMESSDNEMNGQNWPPIRGDCEEVSNHSNNSLLDFPFPSNESQCDFDSLDDQLFEDNILEEPLFTNCDLTNGIKRPGLSSDEIELDSTAQTQTSMFDFQNPKANSSVVFTSKTNSN